ncbi:thiol-disulfide oxidoreductase DCC family protein [Roseibium sp. MMSF_3544]|uniref:thiol-disulfide oxidoreductase DCC family protein n=1 Tax=unclassified Roseibium TaxID=2629323 RepID=UPI00273D17C8|nr:DUF393 domain-containing protein [Roseibium sp. MMSF_3544]
MCLLITVFYDGKCGLCSREIGYYKKLKPRRSILWNDIAHEPQLLDGTGLTQADALLFLRTRDEHGTLHSGLDAFLVIWRQFRGWSLLGRLLSVPGIYSVTSWAYGQFARRRFARHAHCQASLETS